MKKARMNISHFRFILFNLKIFSEIVTTKKKTHRANRGAGYFFLEFSDVPPQKNKGHQSEICKFSYGLYAT